MSGHLRSGPFVVTAFIEVYSANYETDSIDQGGNFEVVKSS